MKHELPSDLKPESAKDATIVRVTVPVRSDVLEMFQRLAKAGSMSTGKAMGEWLADTSDAAQFMAQKMEQARAAPRIVAREMHAYALGLADETGALIERVREKGREARRRGATSGAPDDGSTGPTPRPVIRGGKSHPTGGKAGRAGGSSK